MTQEKSCSKVVYKTLNDAKKASKFINFLKRKQKEVCHPITAYQCPNCKNYHLTSKDQKFYTKIGISDKEYEKILKKREREHKKEEERISDIIFGTQL